MTRSPKEKLVDRLLLLHLLSKASEIDSSLGVTKIEKLVFLSEWAMISNREKGFNYSYIKLTYGPYSDQLLRQDLPWLITSGIVEGRTLSPTEMGKAILDDFKDLFSRNEVFIRRIDRTVEEYIRMPLKELLNMVYSMSHPYIKGRTICDVKERTPLLYALDERKARKVFNLTPEEIATLEIYFDTKAFKSLMEAMEDKKPTLTFEKVV
ncbi:MAG: hypothetical protein AOA66_1375 [Candidatus Bathyarchaeota archaeon BA2]|nr:MAG: hypothetical protein AOA66_1375 [Candidatus Bathyarchaeota archaeon BA2]